MGRGIACALLLAGTTAGWAADEHKSPQPQEMGRAPQTQPAVKTLTMKLPPVRPTPAPGTGAAPELNNVRALGVETGQARLVVDGQAVTVRVGDSLAAATVRSIVPGRLVLQRQAVGSEGDLLLVTFDAQGRPHVRGYAVAAPPAPYPLAQSK
jgi:hypothetical protein